MSHAVKAKINEEESLKYYKWNFDGILHEFNLLHNRAGHYINVNWMLIAVYMPVFGVTLTNLGNRQLRYFACPLLTLIAILGLMSAFYSIEGIRQAVKAIKRYIQNQDKIEQNLGRDNTFISAISLGRIPDSTGDYKEHNKSLRFHRALPKILIALWSTLLCFAVLLLCLPSVTP
jgi:hypothetical protein